MGNYYYLDKQNRQVGPLSAENIRKLHLPGRTLVWTEGMATWMPIEKVPALRDNSRKGNQVNGLRILLIIFAGTFSLLFLFIGRFVAAFTASSFDTYAYIPPLITGGAAILVVLCFLFIKRRKYFINVLLLMLPFLISSLYTSLYYLNRNVSPYRNGICIIEKRDGSGVLNQFGWERIPCRYDNIAWNNYWDPVYFRVWKDGKMGILDLSGNVIIPCEFSDIDFFNGEEEDDLVIVQKDGEKGLYSMSGEVIIPCEFSSINLFKDDDELILAKTNDKVGLYSIDGEVIIPGGIYDDICPWRDTRLLLVKQDETRGLYRRDGQEILPCRYIIGKRTAVGLSKLNQGGWIDDNNKIRGGLWGILDENGNIVLDCIFDEVTILSSQIRAIREGVTYYYSHQGEILSHGNIW